MITLSSSVNVRRGRVQALDSVRAVALLLMIVGHVANYSFLWRTSHFAYYVWDGASIFILVSGIVVAQINRRRIETTGFASAAGRLFRRAAFLFLIQFVLVALATATAYFRPSETSAQFLVPGLSSWPQVLLWDAMLGANPIYVNFLSSYVVILLAAVPALWLLRARRYGLLILFAALIYIAGLVWPHVFTLPNGSEGLANFDNATWFVLFMSGMVLGWFWFEHDVDSALARPRVVLIAAAIVTLSLVTAIWDALPTHPPDGLNWFMDKNLMAPGRFIAAWAFLIVLLWIMRRLALSRTGDHVVGWLATLGAYPVDTIVILTLVTIATQGILGWESSGRGAQLLALGTIILTWMWARSREKRTPRLSAPTV